MKKFKLALLALSVVLIMSVLTGCCVNKTFYLAGYPFAPSIKVSGNENNGTVRLNNAVLYKSEAATTFTINGVYTYSRSGNIYTILVDDKDKNTNGTYCITAVDMGKGKVSLFSRAYRSGVPLQLEYISLY